MRLRCVRHPNITQKWMTVSIGGIEIIDMWNSIHTEKVNRSRLSKIPFRIHHQVSMFSTKDLSSSGKSTSTKSSKTKDEQDITPSRQPKLPNHLPEESDRMSSNVQPPHKDTSSINNNLQYIPAQIDLKIRELKRPYERRLIVKLSSAMNDDNISTIINNPYDLRQRVGIVNRRFPLEHEITDSGGKTIWIPVKTIVNEDRIVATQLPQINASAWLDPSTYCRGGGKTIAGTVAARQLLHGKKDLMEVLGHVVYSSTSKLVQRHRSIVLCGHGVPPQLLQHHIDSADMLLSRLDASEVSFKQFNVSQSHNSVASTEAVRDIRWGHIRDAVTGENRVVTWPIDNEENWEYDLQLYWTVMNRIATRIGLPVLLRQPQTSLPKVDTFSRRQRADYSLPVVPSNLLRNIPPHHWRVKFSRELHFSPDQIPKSRFNIHPVVEWTPLEGIAAPGHVCIRLQGESDRGNSTNQISLCFDASFRSKNKPAVDVY